MKHFRKREEGTNQFSMFPSILNSNEGICEEIPTPIKYIPDMGDGNVTLIKGDVNFETIDFYGQNIQNMTVNYNQKIVYNKVTKTFEGLELTEQFCEKISKDNLEDVIEFIMEVIQNENLWVYNLFTRETSDIKYITSWDVSTQAKNLLKHIDRISLFEKVAKVNGGKIIFENLKDKNFNLNDSKKLKKVVGVSQIATDYLKKEKIEETLPQMQVIFSENENDGNEFVEYLKALKKITKYSKWDLVNFIKTFAGIIEEGYRTHNVLNHLVRENYFFERLGLPSSLAGELKDTISMAKMNNLPMDKLPKNITKYHAILSANCDIMKNSRAEEFKLATSMYNRLEHEGKEYLVRVPRDERDLLEEGNLLHHCVASYRDKIIDEKAIVLFVRKTSEPDAPFVTIELDENLNFLQIKEIYDADVTDKDVLDYLTKWINSKRYIIENGKSVFKKPENKMSKKAQKEAGKAAAAEAANA